MKFSVSLMTLFILSTLMTMAKAEVNCEIKDEQMSTVQRVAMLKKCLMEASSKANVKHVAEQQKKQGCEQNASNKGLEGTERENYIARCM